ncbi:unnamed protein product [Rotaria magnacalcarata]|uniref:Uncharacterized protein n=1 Tax=Rotaria magnacalcarata TaxID=392030 RepID=A0A816SBU5_9BILA|nr:unnamed protein product [Rotaria magnacalcarata]
MRLDPQGSLPLILCQSDRGENFVLYEDNSMVIFACDRNLSVSNQCEHWFMDGTFSNEREKLMALAFVPVADVIKAYSCLINDFDDDDNPLLDYFERVWVGQKKGRGSRRSKPKFSLPVIRFEV